ncbi:efflux RND transporter periplasmic adaptor subunit [Brumimicrobium aurantiacum]|uniref:Efflux RND transporter periplasmic adaptor subunit n=1 Tax=Brumimicrobium aurantiacum TaxID=1737063 RepID=A0A3E1F0H4_9FLAO|nr:efflux RND transporter periplasmic adaptor subunit [Brumimicrobium aurantiacum]RFC55304.1 efflux RND transporter periplasmic adaptor subunit [Brumimicrobium aurantiacum]
MTNWNKNTRLLLSGTIIMSLLLSCSEREEKKNTGDVNKNKSFCLDENLKIKTVNPVHEMIINEIPMTGVVETVPDKVIHFSNLVNGIIVSTNFSLGDFVHKGQVLAKVKSTELSEWKSQQKILTSQLTVAKQEFKSVQSMFKDGIASLKQLNQSESAVISLTSELEELSSNLALYNASTENGVFLIKAPGSGYITEKNITSGTHVSAYNESLFTISDISEVWVQISVYPSNIQNINQGMEVHIRSLSYPNINFIGRIDAIPHVIDNDSRILKARVSIDNKDKLLKPGMFVDVIAKQKTDQKAISIPTDALIFDDNENFVMIYKDDCNIIKTPVNFISQNNDKCYIEDNLNPEDKIIVKNNLLLFAQIKNFQKQD